MTTNGYDLDKYDLTRLRSENLLPTRWRVVTHLQDDFVDQLAIIKSKHDNDNAELKNQIKELKAKAKRGPRGPRGARGPAGKPPKSIAGMSIRKNSA